MRVVRRAVERVDDPAIARVAAGSCAALLAQHGVRRKRLQERRQDFVLTLEVDVGHDVHGALVANLADRVHAAAENAAGRARRLDGHLSGAPQIEIACQTRAAAYRLANRAAAAGATFSGGRKTIAPLSQAASHR